MKISEASVQAGVSIPTFKYYLREGLVQPGERLSTNQTAYDDTHVQRVRLVRALIETGGLSIAAAKRVLATLDSGTPLAYTFEAAQHALAVGGAGAVAAQPDSLARIGALTASHAWAVTPENPGANVAARALDALAAIGFTPSDEYLDAYASAASTIAHADLTALTTRSRPELIAELMVVGTVLGDALIAGLRRLAQENATADLFPADAGTDRKDAS